MFLVVGGLKCTHYPIFMRITGCSGLKKIINLIIKGNINGNDLFKYSNSYIKLTNTIKDISNPRTSKIPFSKWYVKSYSCYYQYKKIIDALKTIKENTSHLKGLKIAVMGCIVNGPGEMADAHYGYVGAGNGQITLYKGKTVVEKNIPEDEALEKLIELIKINGDWKERTLE